MKLNSNKLLINMLLAGISEKMLKDKQADISGNWKTEQGLLLSLFPDPAIGMVFHQNEVSKEDEKIMQLHRAMLAEGIAIINEFINSEDPISNEEKKDYYNRLDLLKPYITDPNHAASCRNAIEDRAAFSQDSSTLQQQATVIEQETDEQNTMLANIQNIDKDNLKMLSQIGEDREKGLNDNDIWRYSDFEKAGFERIKSILKEVNTAISEDAIHDIMTQARQLAEQQK